LAERTLFIEYDLRASQEAHENYLVAEVDEAPEDHVLQVDTESWAESLAARWGMNPAEIHPDQVSMDQPEPCQVDDSHWPGRDVGYGSPLTAGHRTTIHLPFSGDGETLKMQPNAYHFGPKPQAEIGSGELRASIQYPDDRPFDIDSEAARWISMIEKELQAVRGDLDGFDEQLRNRARSAIEGRRERIKRHEAQLAKSKIPVRTSREEGKAYVVDAIERRPPPPAEAMSLTTPLPLEPTISDELYGDIIETLSKTSRGMERSVRTYEGMGEEDLRHVISLPLNDRFRGQGTGETFNSKGKADLLLRWDDQNLFVCEMKIWSGEKEFGKAIRQLFEYVTWRDTGMAVVVFVKQKRISSVVVSAKSALEDEDYFLEMTSEFEGGFRAQIKQPRDEERDARLSVLFVHLNSG
jgi:hypothetical protein